MKKFTIILTVLIAFTIETNAQIPNGGFENWISTVSYDDPVDWATMNQWCTGPTFYSVTKSTDHYPQGIGNLSVRIECNTSLSQYDGGWGVIATKAFDFPFKPAFSISNNPTRLCGYAKYLPENGDEAVIRVVLFKNGAEVVNNSTTISGTGSTWQSFSVEFDEYEEADSATIIIMAWKPIGQTAPPNGNSVIYIDNLSFDDFITSVSSRNLKDKSISLYPNPAKDTFTLFVDKNRNIDIKLNIYNSMGLLVKSTMFNQNPVNISELSNGMYTVEIRYNGLIEYKKLIIQK